MKIGELKEFLESWGQGIVNISNCYRAKEDYKKEAETFIKKFYGFGMLPILFKPTKAAEKQFRSDFDGALSYFVGDNSDFSEDKGFAISDWKNVEFEYDNFASFSDNSVMMGNYYFTNHDNERVKVEFTFGVVKEEAGSLRIYLHHSSIPYCA